MVPCCHKRVPTRTIWAPRKRRHFWGSYQANMCATKSIAFQLSHVLVKTAYMSDASRQRHGHARQLSGPTALSSGYKNPLVETDTITALPRWIELFCMICMEECALQPAAICSCICISAYIIIIMLQIQTGDTC